MPGANTDRPLRPDPAPDVRFMTPPTPFPCAYWVDPGMFLAGEYPGAPLKRAARRKVRALLDCGIRRIINLMEADERDYAGNAFRPYEPLVRSLAPPAPPDVICRRYPIRDMAVPAPFEMRAILDAIDAALEDAKPVYVHCLAGVGRTGTVVGCWLVRHGRASGSDVIDLIRELRQNDPHAHWLSPQSAVQRNMVRHWRCGQ